MKTNFLEAELKLFYDQIKQQLPKLNRVTFELQEYTGNSGISIRGFYHLDNNCRSYDNLQDLVTQIIRNKILYRKF